MVGMPITNVKCYDFHDGLIYLEQQALRLMQSEYLLIQDVYIFWGLYRSSKLFVNLIPSIGETGAPLRNRDSVLW